MDKFFNLFYERLLSETPVFFKRIIAFGITLGGIGASLLLLEGRIPPALYNIAGYLVTVGLVAATIAKATTTDTDLSKK